MPHYSPEYRSSRPRWSEPRRAEDRGFERDFASRRGRFAPSRRGRFRGMPAYGHEFDAGPRDRFEGEFGEGGWRGRARRDESDVAGRWYGTVFSAAGRHRPSRRPRESGDFGSRPVPHDTRFRRYGSMFAGLAGPFGRYGREFSRLYGREYGGFSGRIGAWGKARTPRSPFSTGYGQPFYGARGAGLDYDRDFFGGYIAGRYGGGTTGGAYGGERATTDPYDIAYRNYYSSRFGR